MAPKQQYFIKKIFEASENIECDLRALSGVCLDVEEIELEVPAANDLENNVQERRENKPREFISGFEFAKGVTLVQDNDLSACVRKMAREWIILESKRAMEFDKFPGATPISMSRDNIQLLCDDFVVSWKADGTRYLMVILERDQVYCIGTACDVFLIEGLTFPRANSLDDHFTNVLLDGEMILDLVDGEKVPRCGSN